MPAITVKNIPDKLYDQLRASAELNRRSINSELIACLEMVLEPKKLTAQEHLAGARSIRERFTAFKVSEKDLKDAKNSGRL